MFLEKKKKWVEQLDEKVFIQYYVIQHSETKEYCDELQKVLMQLGS